MTIDVEQQVGTKDDGYSSKNKQTTTLIFSLVLKKALVVEIHFFIFLTIFLFFSGQEPQKMEPQIWHLQHQR
jgi:hypothetical protein